MKEHSADGAGLAGDEIPLLAAIVGLADAWDAMTTERPYAAAVSVDDALEEVRSGSGSQFAPVVAEALLRVFERDPAEFGAQPRRATV